MREIICILCPRGCELTVRDEHSEPDVTGHGCRKGREFALKEIESPTRVLCTTVKTAFPEVPVLPVRVSAEIPKEKIYELMELIDSHTVRSPLSCGDVVIPDILGLGVDLIATSSIIKSII